MTKAPDQEVWGLRTARNENSVLGGRGPGGGQFVGLIVHPSRHGTQLVAVFTCVVGAEEEFTAALELNPKVGLSSATVASVLCRQGGSSGKCSGHNGLISLRLSITTYRSEQTFPNRFRCLRNIQSCCANAPARNRRESRAGVSCTTSVRVPPCASVGPVSGVNGRFLLGGAHADTA